MKILITGATGFLGSAVVSHFNKLDFSLALVCHKNIPENLIKNNSLHNGKITAIDASNDLHKAINFFSPDIVIHAACNYGRNHEGYKEIAEGNVMFGLMVLDSIKNLVHPVTFLNMGTTLNPQVNFYALSKDCFSKMGELASKQCQSIQFLDLKIQHMYGPCDSQEKFITYLINSMLNSCESIPLTLGEQIRDFIYIDDVVSAIEKIIENRTFFSKHKEIELGSGVGVRIREVVELIARVTKSKNELAFGSIKYRENEQMYSCADIGVLKKIGWQPEFSLEEGVRMILRKEFLL
jgi:CDP-paratose synthetase